MRFSYSFISLLYVYNELINEVPKRKRYKQLEDFMSNRMVRNKEYFENNGKICSVYNFHKKVVDNLLE